LNELPNEIFRRWVHSFEEDEGDVSVYRPAEYAFPRARGRREMEFRPDGSFIHWMIGPADARQPASGHWRVEGSNRVHVSFEGDSRPPRILEVQQCDAEALKVRQRAAPA